MIKDIYAAWLAGQLQPFIDSEIDPSLADHYCRIYQQYKQLRDSGNNYIEACELSADKLCVTDRTVKRAIAYVITRSPLTT